MNPLRLSFMTLLAWCCVAGIALASGAKVVVYPFEVYNAPDVAALAPGLQSMLASRLEGQGYSVETAQDRSPKQVDWAVRTTVTQLGGVYSIDASLEPSAPRTEGTRTYETAKSPDAILPALETIAGRLKGALERLAASSGGLPSGPSPQATGGQRQPAPVAAAARPPATPAPSPTQPPEGRDLQAALDFALKEPRLGPKLPGSARSIAVADVDGDGTNEILVLVGDEVVAFRDSGKEISRMWDNPAASGFSPLVLSVGDVDGNGKADVFVAGTQGTALFSQAWEWSGSGLVPKGDRIPALVRAVSRPGMNAELLGMVSGMERQVFASGVRSFSWEDGAYRESGKASVPPSAEGVNLNWVEFEPHRPAFAVVTTQNNHLRIYDSKEDEVYESSDYVQGSTNMIVGQESGPGRMDADVAFLQGKTAAWRGTDGATYLLLPKNIASFSRFFSRSPSYSHVQFLALRWSNVTLVPASVSPQIAGSVPDIDLGPTPDGRGGQTLYAVLVQSKGVLFDKSTSRIVACDLPASPQPQ